MLTVTSPGRSGDSGMLSMINDGCDHADAITMTADTFGTPAKCRQITDMVAQSLATIDGTPADPWSIMDPWGGSISKVV